MKTVIRQIEMWADEYGLLDSPCPKNQVIRCAEKLGETCSAVLNKAPINQVKIGIGEVGNTLILFSVMENIPLPYNPRIPRERALPVDVALRLLCKIGQLAETTLDDGFPKRHPSSLYSLISAWNYLHDLAYSMDATLEDCLMLTYEKMIRQTVKPDCDPLYEVSI